ncbi:MAG: DUF2326 domain-containing protein [Bacilli bacterium]
MLKKIEFNNIDLEDINFYSGVNIILGDKEDNDNTTNNSVGKTLLIETINHLLGSSRRNQFNFAELKNVSVIGTFEFDEKVIKIERYYNYENEIEEKNVNIIKNEFISLNNGSVGFISLREWLDFLKEKYVLNNYMSFRKFNAMFLRVEDIQNFKDAIKSNQTDNNMDRGKYNSYFLNLGYEVVSKQTLYNNNDKKILRSIAPTLDKVIKHEEMEEDILDIQENYTSIAVKLRTLYDKNRILRSRKKVLSVNLKEINSMSSQDFAKRFDIYRGELEQYLLKNYEETKLFHERLIGDNKSLIEEELMKITSSILVNEEKIKELQTDKIEIGNMIKKYSEDDIYANATRELLSKFMKDKSVEEIAKDADSIIKNETTKTLNELLANNERIIKEYKEFLLRETKLIYQEIDQIDFNIFINPYGVFDMDFTFEGSTGEGKGTVRTLLYIYLLLYINQGRCLDYLIFDSKVIDSVDINILNKLLSRFDSFGKSNNVQFICAGNKQNFVKDNNFYKAIRLTPEKPLFRKKLTVI